MPQYRCCRTNLLPLTKEYGSMGTQQLKRLKEFEREKRLTSARCSRFEFGKGNFGGNSKGKLLSPARRRECVRHVHEKMSVSERKVCLVLGQNRTPQRYQPVTYEYTILLRQAVRNYASEYGRTGIGAITDLLRMDGWGINYKRVERI